MKPTLRPHLYFTAQQEFFNQEKSDCIIFEEQENGSTKVLVTQKGRIFGVQANLGRKNLERSLHDYLDCLFLNAKMDLQEIKWEKSKMNVKEQFLFFYKLWKNRNQKSYFEDKKPFPKEYPVKKSFINTGDFIKRIMILCFRFMVFQYWTIAIKEKKEIARGMTYRFFKPKE